MAAETKKPKIRFKGYDDEWEERKLEEVCLISTGKSNTQDKTDEGIYPFYVRSPIIEKSNKYLYDEEAVLTVGDGVGTGKVFHYVNGKYDLHQRVYRLFDFIPDVSAKFFFYWFSEHFYERVMSMTAKTSVDSVRLEMISEMDFVVPNLREQKKISDLLDNLDNLITLHQRKYEKLLTVKKSMLEKMFPKDGQDKPEIRFAGFTDAWERRKLGDIIEINSGYDYKHLSPGNIPVYGTGGYMLSVDKALSYNKDAIGIGRKGTINKPYILKAPFWTVDTLFYAIPKLNINIDFLFGIFQKIDWLSYDESTGLPSLSKSIINQIEILKTSLAEQQKIGEYFRNLDNLITLNQRKLEKLQNVKKACLEKMFV